MPETPASDLFLGLVASLQASAWMSMGKILNPMTGKVARDLDQAKETIDLLGVLEEKTRGNLHADEARLLGQILYELRMNYVEEMRTQTPPEAPAATGPAASPPASPPTEVADGAGDPSSSPV